MKRSFFRTRYLLLIKRATEKPKRLFLVDCMGALLSAFLLGVVLVRWQPIFGIPEHMLYFLASLPIVFAIYDLLCYRFAIKNIRNFLKAISLMNIGYGALSISLASYHFHEISVWGWSYILMEVIIIILLAMIEWRVATNLWTE